MRKILVVMTLVLVLITGCGKEEVKVVASDVNQKRAEVLIEKENAILIDVRSKEEYENKHIDGSINIDVNDIETVEEIYKDKNRPIILYCRSGNRSMQAANKLIKMGYTKIYNLGAITNWEE